jgi:hypothetical protein
MNVHFIISIELVLLIILGIGIFFTGLFFYVGQYFIDKQRRFLFIYFLGGFSFVCGIVFFVIFTGLALNALRIYWRLNKHSTTEEKAMRLFKERVSIILFII